MRILRMNLWAALAAHFLAGLVGCLGPHFSIMGGSVLADGIGSALFCGVGERPWRRTLVGGHGLVSTLAAAHKFDGHWVGLAQDNLKMPKLTGL